MQHRVEAGWKQVLFVALLMTSFAEDKQTGLSSLSLVLVLYDFFVEFLHYSLAVRP